jgi:hypothetical protein
MFSWRESKNLSFSYTQNVNNTLSFKKQQTEFELHKYIQRSFLFACSVLYIFQLG